MESDTHEEKFFKEEVLDGKVKNKRKRIVLTALLLVFSLCFILIFFLFYPKKNSATPEVYNPTSSSSPTTQTAPQTTTQSQDKKLTIIIASYGYEESQKSSFINFANEVKNYTLSMQPFKARSSQIDFVMDFGNRGNAKCDGLSCDLSLINNLRSKYPKPNLVEIVENTESMDAGAHETEGYFVIGRTPGGGATAVHELGHLFGLGDEYPASLYSAFGPNCYTGKLPLSDPTHPWYRLIGIQDYTPDRCENGKGYFAPSFSDKMHSTLSQYFNSISVDHINKYLDEKVGTFNVKSEPPKIKITNLKISKRKELYDVKTILDFDPETINKNNLQRFEIYVNGIFWKTRYLFGNLKYGEPDEIFLPNNQSEYDIKIIPVDTFGNKGTAFIKRISSN